MSASAWFSQALGRPCHLVRQTSGSRRSLKGTGRQSPRPHKQTEQQTIGEPSHASPCLPTTSKPSTWKTSCNTECLADLSAVLKPFPACAGFANEAQVLLLSQSSLLDLRLRLSAPQAEASDQASLNVSAERFRPNLLAGGSLQPYEEDTWQEVAVGEARLSSAGVVFHPGVRL